MICFFILCWMRIQDPIVLKIIECGRSASWKGESNDVADTARDPVRMLCEFPNSGLAVNVPIRMLVSPCQRPWTKWPWVVCPKGLLRHKFVWNVPGMEHWQRWCWRMEGMVVVLQPMCAMPHLIGHSMLWGRWQVLRLDFLGVNRYKWSSSVSCLRVWLGKMFFRCFHQTCHELCMRRWHFNTSWIISSLWNWPNLHSSIFDTPFFTFSQKVGCFPTTFPTSEVRPLAQQSAPAFSEAQPINPQQLPQYLRGASRSGGRKRASRSTRRKKRKSRRCTFFFLGGWVYHPYDYRLPLFWGGWLAVCKSRFFVKRMTNDGSFLWKWKEIIMKIQLHIVRLDLENVVWISVRSAKRWLDRSRSNSHTATGQYIRATGCSSTVRRLFLPRGRE